MDFDEGNQLLGFAIIDRRPDSGRVAVWLTSRTEAKRAEHTNAVVVDLAEGRRATTQLFDLTRLRAVLATEPSTVCDLGLTEEVILPIDLQRLILETKEQQGRIISAIEEYGRRSRNRYLVKPDFLSEPRYAAAHNCCSVARVLELAEYLRASWEAWLVTEHERVRRTVQPRTGDTPWMMPESMNSPTILELPSSFRERLPIQSLRGPDALAAIRA